VLQFYKTERNIAKVRDKYREEYGPGTQFEDCKNIKSRLNKAFRAAIRKVKALAGETRESAEFLPFLNSLNNERIKKILISPDALEARVILCDIYSAKSVTSTLMEKTVALMKEAILRIEKRFPLKNDFHNYNF
jgi:hypothetical protein